MALSDFKILGVMNVTPDSFSDGGSHQSPELFLDRVRTLIADGADYLDIGAESTRPGAKAISSKEEWTRLEDKLELLKEFSIPISLDTMKEDVAIQAMERFSISVINSMSGPFSTSCLNELLRISKIKKQALKFCAGHMHGSPETMQESPLRAQDVFSVVDDFFKKSHATLLEAGFSKDCIILDPGIGFGKTDPANFVLLENTVYWSNVYNLMIGVSRKGIIGRMLSISEPSLRDPGSKVLETALALMGARLVRTHDVKGLVKVRQLARGA